MRFMRFRMTFGGALSVMICLGLVLAAGCGSGTSRVEPTLDEPSRDAPGHLLDWYIYAIEHEDIDMYGDALHDNFIFVFWASVADSLGLPPDQPWWGKMAELAAMHSLFEDSTVIKIEFKFTHVDRWFPVELEIEPGNFIDGLCIRTTPVTRLTIQEPGQEPKILIFDASYLDITVVRDPKFPDQNLWVIARIEEVLKNSVAPNLRQHFERVP